MEIKVYKRNEKYEIKIENINSIEESETLKEYILKFEKNETFQVSQGKNIYHFLLSDFNYFFSENKAIYGSINGQKYRIENTLESISRNNKFIRVSKSTIVNVECIDYIRPMGNGKHIVVLEEEAEIILSRKYYKSFVERMVGTNE